MITRQQCRTARQVLEWDYTQLAAAAKIHVTTAFSFELGQSRPQPSTLIKIRTAFESAGVEFIAENGGGPGVRLRKADTTAHS